MKFNTCALFAFGILAAVDAQEMVEERSVRMKNKVCTGEPKKTLDNTSNFNKAFKCKKKCLNTKWCQQIGFEFKSATGKIGTCHLYDAQSKVSSLLKSCHEVLGNTNFVLFLFIDERSC